MKIRSLLTALAFALSASMISASAQEVVVIGGVKYSIHDVVKGETLYSLARKYGVTVDDIVGANATLTNGLKAGQRIKIPIKTEVEVAANTPSEEVAAKTHKVAKRETLYSLSKR